jgi:type IV pilus assembly protein PilX
MNISTVNLIKKQRGTVLVASLFFLMILTILGVSSVNRTSIQNKVSANNHNTDLAFQASETSLSAAEEYLKNLVSVPAVISNCATPPCNNIWAKNALDAKFKGSSAYWWASTNPDTNSDWWPVYATAPNPTTQKVSYVSEQPLYFIEEYGYLPDDLSPGTRAQGVGTYYYRVTARGTGGVAKTSGNSPNQAMVQSIYAKRFN